jgi:hypothetical protein
MNPWQCRLDSQTDCSEETKHGWVFYFGTIEIPILNGYLRKAHYPGKYSESQVEKERV